MKLNRDFTNIFNWIFDNLIPPFLRDNKYFMFLVFYPLFGKKSRYFMKFKQKAPFLTEKEFQNYYHLLSDKHINRATDLNKKSINFIIENIAGDKILDIACGRGFLVNKLAGIYPEKQITGIDIILPKVKIKHSNTEFVLGNIEHIDFPDNYFDTVICAHTLEHVQNIHIAINELRRVTKQKLIIVVPRQREYKFTFDLHLHFFPYTFTLQKLMNNSKAIYKTLGNDFVYLEEL